MGDTANDLHVAFELDFDEEISVVLKKHDNCKYDRLRKDREDRKVERERQQRKAEAQAAYDKAKKEEKSSIRRVGGMPGGFSGGMPGGFGGMLRGFGGMPGSSTGGMPGSGSPGECSEGCMVILTRKSFKESSEEEREHAEKFMEYQNKHGGKVKLQSVLIPLIEFDHAEKDYITESFSIYPSIH